MNNGFSEFKEKDMTDAECRLELAKELRRMRQDMNRVANHIEEQKKHNMVVEDQLIAALNSNEKQMKELNKTLAEIANILASIRGAMPA